MTNKRKDDCMNKKKAIILSLIIIALIIFSITFVIPFIKDVANVQFLIVITTKEEVMRLIFTAVILR